MSKYEVFKKAPITEAVLEIIVKLKEGADLKTLEGFYEQIKERFPVKENRLLIRGGFEWSREGSVSSMKSSKEMQGYIYRSPIEKKVIMTRLDGFSFHKLKPYDNWEVFSLEAKEFWKHYFQLANVSRITSIALRYINRIEVPFPFSDFSEYILTNPQIAEGLPQGLSNFFMRLDIPYHDLGAQAVITQTMEKQKDKNKLALILDIDVRCENEYSTDSKEMWDDFQKLRDFKNDIFFKSLTEKAKELFR